MNKYLIYLIVLTSIYLASCGDSGTSSDGEKSSLDSTVSEPKKLVTPSVSGPSNTTAFVRIGNIKRAQISAKTWQEFTHFSWDHEETWGSASEYYGQNPVSFPSEYADKFIGVTSDAFERYTTRGDGECWVRAAYRALFHNIFSDDELFRDFLKTLDALEKKYLTDTHFHPLIHDEKIYFGTPWMKNFPWQKFKQGMQVLKRHREQNAFLRILNHDNVDWFLIACIRAIASAEGKYNVDRRPILEEISGFDYDNNRFPDKAEIENLWAQIIQHGATGKDRHNNSLRTLPCGGTYKVLNKGREETRIKYCTREEIIQKVKEQLPFPSYFQPYSWDEPTTFSFWFKSLSPFFALQRISKHGIDQSWQFTKVVHEGVEGKCLEHLHTSRINVLFYDFYSEVVPIHVNGNHYDVLVRKPTARFDYQKLYDAIEDPVEREQVRRCLAAAKKN